MKALLVSASFFLVASMAQAFSFEEVFTLEDEALESLAPAVKRISDLDGVGSCPRFYHRVKFSIGADEDMNVIFHEYLASLTAKGDEMDFAFIRYLETTPEVVKATTRTIAPRNASDKIVAELGAFADLLTSTLFGREWIYSGGVVRYINKERQTAVALINIRAIRDVARNEFLIWGNGTCTP